jgi:putative addiction module antidote
MRKKLTAIGNSVGLIIDKPVLELLGLDQDDEVEITSDGERLIVSRVGARRRRVEAVLDDILEEHAETLRRLAQ